MTDESPLRGLIFDIEKFAVHDGPGIRTAVFVKGCPLRCLWCHNPESQAPRPEVAFLGRCCIEGCDDCIQACPRGALARSSDASGIAILRERCDLCLDCVAACPSGGMVVVGEWMTVEQVFAQVRRNQSFYRHSGGGVTVTGGEPLTQWRFVRALLARCREDGISTALDTCGHASWEHLSAVLEHTDLLLYDVKEMDPDRHDRFTGVPNRLILDNLRRASELGIAVALRIPLITGHNDSEDNVRAIGQLARGLPSLVQIELIPYHRLGETKYRWLDRSYPLGRVQAPSDAHLARLRGMLEAMGHRVQIGG